MSSKTDARMPLPKLILADGVGAILGLSPAVLAWSSVVAYLRWIWGADWFLGKALAAPAVLVFTFIGITFVLRLCLPPLKPGVYDLKSPGMRAWYMHFLLANGLHASGLMPLIHCFYLTRFLYWRAMGARTAYGIHCSVFTRMRDFPLLSIGDGSNLSANTHIACHTFVGEKLLLGKVEIGERCFIGMDVTIGPRTKIGDGSYIGYGNRIIMERFAEGSRLENFEYAFGNPERLKKAETDT